MLQVLTIILPIFLLIGTGFAAIRGGVLAATDMRILGTFTITFAMPALIIRTFVLSPIREVIDLRFLSGYGVVSAMLFAIVYLGARRLYSQPAARTAMQAMGASMSNSGFIGFPVATMALGANAALGLAMCLLVENFLILPAALVLAEKGRASGRATPEILAEIAGRLARNPLVIAIFTGMMLALTGLKMPAPLFRAVDLLAGTAAPVALFAIGGILAGMKPGGQPKGIGLVVLGKLILHPLGMLGAVALWPPADPALAKAMLIFASAPMIAVYPIIGGRYGEEEFCAATLFVTMICGFVTLSAVLFLTL
ncbi:MAG TPA: AEC family transporter [Rhabdaerophilum sp.]|nr:AEC family transporter [Rhabdaerophilum sp.]